MAESSSLLRRSSKTGEYVGFLFTIIVGIQMVLLFSGPSSQVSTFYLKESNSKTTATPNCVESMPCGWEVYHDVNKQVRTSSYFVNSPCKCPDNFRCVRDNDVLSINSYVHRCKPNSGESIAT